MPLTKQKCGSETWSLTRTTWRRCSLCAPTVLSLLALLVRQKRGKCLTQRHTCSDLREFTCFTSTKVQILTQRHTCSDLRAGDGPLRARQGTQFTRFTGTKAQILTQKALLTKPQAILNEFRSAGVACDKVELLSCQYL